jgi:hypothetical protein
MCQKVQQLSADMPNAERSAAGAAAKDDPQSLARRIASRTGQTTRF